jgi:hypothetical protein
MKRRFRYYGKKRGHRRTGSPAWGNFGEAVFSGILLLLGCCGVVWMLAAYVVPEWRVNHEFVETTCQVVKTHLGERNIDGSGAVFRPEIKIRYEVAGVEYQGWHYDIWYDDFDQPKSETLSEDQKLRKSYKYGHEAAQIVLDGFEPYPANHRIYSCWYDPANPGVAVLVRGYSWVEWLAFTIPLAFVIVGTGGLAHAWWHWGKSAERRAVIAQRAGDRERKLFGGGLADSRRYPTVPQGADITNSPGTKLKFRLPMAISPGWALFGTLAFCIVWNSFVVALIVMIIRGLVAGERVWNITLLSLPFAAIGGWAVVLLVRQLLVATGIGPMLLEISDHPLVPGGRYRLFLSQSGWLSVKTLRASLTCEEAATYRQGTDARTETREVHRQELLRQTDFEIRGGAPFERDIDLNIPDGVMHSFSSQHNEIAWKIVVEGEAVGWPAYRRAFPVIVRPASGGPDQ